MGLDDFEHIEKDGLNFYKCKGCGEVLPSGIVGISSHWAGCTGKGFYDTLTAIYTIKQQRDAMKDNGSLMPGIRKIS